MFGSPPKFKSPFASDSRRNSLENSIWAPLPTETALQGLHPTADQAHNPPYSSLQPSYQAHQAPGQTTNHAAAGPHTQNYFQNPALSAASRVHMPQSDLLPQAADFSHFSHFSHTAQNPRTSLSSNHPLDSPGAQPWQPRPHFNSDPQHLAQLPPGFAQFYSYDNARPEQPDAAMPHLAPGLWGGQNGPPNFSSGFGSFSSASGSGAAAAAVPESPQKSPVWGPSRRHSIGDVFPYSQPLSWNPRLSVSSTGSAGSASYAAPGPASAAAHSTQAQTPQATQTSQNTSRAAQSSQSQVAQEVHDYFSSDPHERVKVTAEYLAQRYFDEEKYLSNSYQLPKFPVESSLAEHHLVLVAFKAGRIDVFYLPPALEDKPSVTTGALVMVEADRGRDLGKIVKMNISIDEARLLKLLQFLEQQAALCDTAVGDLSVRSLHANSGSNSNSPSDSPGTGSNTSSGVAPPTLHFPKPIIGLASHNEAMQILNKKQDEEKACRLCLAKIASTSNMLSNSDKSSASLSQSDLMQMKLVDAEYQFDRKKLIFYYSTSRRIDFRDLVRELFRIYKTRIWMCAVNGIPYVPQHKKRLSGSGQSQSSTPQSSRGSASMAPEEYGESLMLKSLVDTLNR